MSGAPTQFQLWLARLYGISVERQMMMTDSEWFTHFGAASIACNGDFDASELRLRKAQQMREAGLPWERQLEVLKER